MAAKITTGKELAAAALNVAKNFKTLYVMGCFGAPMTAANKTRYINNGAHNGYNAKASRKAMINAAGADTFGFDCVCLIKGLLWGWSGDASKTYGGAGYAVNGVPDIGADTMITKCSGVSADFSKIEVGEAVWMSGHIGIYIGDGLAVECTPSWKNCVQVTACNCAKSGYNRRNWTKHGKLPYVTYTGATENVTSSTTATATVTTTAAAYTVGKTNEETFVNFCREVLGLNLAGALGAAVNVERESNFKTGAIGDSGTSYGICQWHAGRYTNLKNWCAANGLDYTTLDGQLWYMKHELETSYSAVLSYIRSVANTADGAYNAGYRWCLKFEIPANTEATSQKRGALARDTYWPKYNGNTSTTAAKPTTPSPAGEKKATEAARSMDKTLAGTYAVNATSGLHIRNGAGTGKASLAVLPNGTRVRNYGYYTLIGGVKWLYVQVTHNGVTYTGFMSSQYLRKQ